MQAKPYHLPEDYEKGIDCIHTTVGALLLAQITTA